MVSDVLIKDISEQMRDLHIIPFEHVRSEIVDTLAEDLCDCGFHVCVESEHSLPSRAFNSRKQKFAADDLLSYLRHEQGGRVLGVMNEDIYRYVINSIKGIADFAGRAAVISLCQLSNQEEKLFLRPRVCKLALHELGHTFGLEHCTNPGCVMHDARSMKLWDCASDEFCPECCLSIKSGPYCGLL